MDKNRNLIIAIAVILILLVGYFFFVIRWSQKSSSSQTGSGLATSTPVNSINYKNVGYGFDFSLPLGWKGYSIVNTNWDGRIIGDKGGDNEPTIKGPEIFIRHPLWTKEKPRQDIPIMIFTPDQWALVQQGKIALGAAPMGPSELGRNARFIFALPARYNYSFKEGYEEIQKIIDSKPLRSF